MDFVLKKRQAKVVGNMDSVIEQLAEIETTAEAIADHAEEEKHVIEKRIQAERDQFDEKLEAETQKELVAIKKEADERMTQVLEEQRKKNSFMLEHLQKEYDGNHELYAKEIVRRIVEV